MLSGGKISKRSIWGAEENSTKVCVFSFDIFSDFCFKCTFLHTWPGKEGRRDIAWAIFKRSEISLICMYLKLGIQSQYLYYQRFYRGVHVCTWGIHRDIIHEKYVRTIQEYTLNQVLTKQVPLYTQNTLYNTKFRSSLLLQQWNL